MRNLFIGLMIGIAALWGHRAMAIEKPNYTVVMSEDNFEIRDYPSMLLAEVKVTGDRNRAANKGFRKLASFIFGDNRSQTKIAMTSPVVQKPQSEKIAMTAPVTQTPINENEWIVNFMMPAEYSMDTLPVPTNSDIRIFETTPYRTVSIRFSGRGRMKNLNKHQSKLDEFVKKHGLETLGGPEYAFYNPPMVPPMFRRNEVHYRVVSPSN